jgi:capsular exopolysaccharide synthesis family protein
MMLPAQSSERFQQSPPDAQAALMATWRALRKNWWLAAAVAALVTLGTVFWTLGQTRIYRAAALVQIDPKPPEPLGGEVQGVVDLGAGAFFTDREYYETQFSIMRSYRVASAIVKALGLHRDAAFLANAAPGQPVEPREVAIEEAATALISRLSVSPIKDSRLVEISIDDADPDRARRLAQAVADTFVQQNLDFAVNSTSSAAMWLEQQLDGLRKELESREMALHAYKRDKNILSLSLDDQNNILRSELQKLNEALTMVRTQRETVAARVAELSKVRTDDPQDLSARELLESELLRRFRADYLDAVKRRDGLRGTGRDTQHPTMLAVEAELNAARDALVGEVRNIKAALERDLRALDREIGGLSALAAAAQSRALDLNRLEIEYGRLQRGKSNTERLYSLVQERTKETELTQMIRENNIRIVDAPRLPKSPVSPRVSVNVALGLLAGLLLGAMAALAREMLDRTVKTPSDVELELGLPLLGIMPRLAEGLDRPYYAGRARRRSEGRTPGPVELIAHHMPASGVAEATRAIRTNLLFMSPDRPLNTLAVTSASPSEGKTTVACSIAIAMAQAGKRVLLVDCDMRRPRVHKLFACINDVGVTTALIDPNSLDGAVRETEIPNLFVLPSGPPPPNPADLLHSAAFAQLIQRVKANFDGVVIDTPPAGPVTDAAVLSKFVDGTVVVVRARETTKEHARLAVSTLVNVGANIAGVVLNAVSSRKRGYYYYSAGYYGETPPRAPVAEAA